jgi:hypothetical protein
MLSVADGIYSADFPETLMEQGKFRTYFEEEVAPGMSRFDKFQNELDECLLLASLSGQIFGQCRRLQASLR